MSRADEKPGRKRALDAMASMPAQLLCERYGTIAAAAPRAIPVRGPEIGAVMVRGRIGGGGAPFNLGEASVTRATVKLDSGEVGHAILLGRDLKKARMVAHLDALGQRTEWQPVIEADVVAPALLLETAARRRRAEETEATRVDFFTLVRGEDR
ncbi:phosphonate C-P lyase system protein PhnG [Rhizobium sp. Leaf341]|jgi:alpha-D-ribose 1-methylphosphonate 5-triphosphate synthase subunit PhnG|uniref:phosphonate C-P lyase system protein PhnG n=1 Tax=Rhizobium sp. Leaf341 TaxID=1736344 RepID=UPI00071529E3|nr:phosphonate C-P lyase system protein PhnG [Rhizobium sp. Leaf341]KQR78050.1 phosphonate C-P lyase system protein PhnG [Rhizobium sp. Leaf341]